MNIRRLSAKIRIFCLARGTKKNHEKEYRPVQFFLVSALRNLTKTEIGWEDCNEGKDVCVIENPGHLFAQCAALCCARPELHGVSRDITRIPSAGQ
jgi:hypothetical protein